MGSTVATDDATMLADQNVAKPIQRRYGNSATVIRSRASSGRGFVSFIVPSHVPFEVAVCKDIVANLLANDHSEPFREPVDRDLYPHYYKVLRNQDSFYSEDLSSDIGNRCLFPGHRESDRSRHNSNQAGSRRVPGLVRTCHGHGTPVQQLPYLQPPQSRGGAVRVLLCMSKPLYY
jgi:hypothetical protein